MVIPRVTRKKISNSSVTKVGKLKASTKLKKSTKSKVVKIAKNLKSTNVAEGKTLRSTKKSAELVNTNKFATNETPIEGRKKKVPRKVSTPEKKAVGVKTHEKNVEVVKEHVAKPEKKSKSVENQAETITPRLKRKLTNTKSEVKESALKNAENKNGNAKRKKSASLSASTTEKQGKLDVPTTQEKLEDLSREHILQCITAIFHLTEEQLRNKNALFDGESHPVFLQVTCIRVPKTPRRQMRLLLPHSIVSPSDEVALFVCDLERGRRKDFEPTVEHYQELLSKHDCTAIKSVIPLNQVKTEYDQYELKRKLVSSYDHFLVDGRIAGHLSHLLGKYFYKKRKLPTSIKMQSKDLKHEIEYALKKTSMELHSDGDTHITQIGSTAMEAEQVADNVLAACSILSKNYPGGSANIRAIRIKTATSPGLPIYMTLKSKNTVKVPIVRPRRPKGYRDVKGELSTTSRRVKVIVKPDGDVILQKKKRKRKNHKNFKTTVNSNA